MNSISLFDDYLLRPLQRQDVDDIFTAIDTQREYLGRWLPFVEATHSPEQTRAFVSSALADGANPVFTLRHGSRFAGLIGFKSDNKQRRSIEIGYWLRSEYQGRGLMTTAVKALCGMAFDEFGMKRVEIRCALGNTPSNRIPCRLGFRLEGVELQAELLSDGTYTDLNLYVLEKEERDAE